MRFIDAQHSLPEATTHWNNTEDVLAHAAEVNNTTAIALQFPKWTDGRAYSQAVLLRLRLRYAGELIATGEVLADMLPLLRRCGFDAVQMRADQKLETAQRALGYFDGHYQQALPSTSTPISQPISEATAHAGSASGPLRLAA